tara:strand:- start:4683 stop:5711 length:1029 start_codon:yes stop_codon:yes gene_type:complete
VDSIYFVTPIQILTLVFLNYFLLKNNLLIDNIDIHKHKSFVNNKKIPISGGLFLIISILFFIKEFDLIYKFLLTSIFVLGLLSDTEKLKSPIIRILFQIILVLFLIFYNSTFIESTRIFAIDYLIQNFFFFKIFFTVFCILILINGTNFIDGVNCLASGYYICIISNLIILINILNLDHSLLSISIIYVALIIFFVFNFFSKTLLGDSGCYLIASILGIYLIDFINFYSNIISPYYIILILWYPAFENLFSICRRIFIDKNKKLDNPDNLHLHQLLFTIFNRNLKLKKYSNSLSGLIIISFNFFIMLIGSQFVNETIKLVYVVLFSLLFYILVYFFLKKKTQ